MRADRLLSIVLLLQAHQQLTAAELASRLEVSKRTIHRDMDALSGAGIPVVAERGAGGGWSLLGEYRTSLTGLNEAEIQSLFVTRPSRLLADLNLEKAAEGAMLKLLAALPSIYRTSAERARERIYIDVSGWHRPEEAVPLLPLLQEAIWLDRKVRFTYESGVGCGAVERTVSPLGLVAKGSVWYLACAVDNQKELRSYRVSRMKKAEIVDGPCQHPAGFDLAAYWKESTAKFKANLPSYRAKMRVHPTIVHRLSLAGRFARIEATDPVDEKGWVPISFRFDVEEMACEYALSFGSAIEVVEPESLRMKVLRAAEMVASLYRPTTKHAKA